MSKTSVFVTHEDKRMEVKFTDFDSLMRKAKEIFNLSTVIRLEYQEENEEWTAIRDDDESLEDISSNSELRLVFEDKEERSINPESNFSSHGATAYYGNDQYVDGNVSGESLTSKNLSRLMNEEYLENQIDFISSEFKKTSEKIRKIISSDLCPNEKVDILKSLIELESFNEIDEEVLRYFLWAYELNDDSFTQKLANCLSDVVDISCTMLPSDFAAFHYVCGMRKQQSITFQTLSDDNFYEDCWHQFLSDKKLHQYLNKVEKLELQKRLISDEEALALVQSSCKIQCLRLNECSFTTIGWRTVISGAANMNDQTETSEQQSNKNYIEATLVMETNKIQSFTLQSCSLTAIEWKTIFGGVANSGQKIEKLELEENKISDEAALALTQCFHNIRQLCLNDCSLTTIGWRIVVSGAANMNDQTETSEQQSNKNYIEATLVMESNKIQSFTLQSCSLTTIEWKTIFGGVANSGQKVEKLELIFNKISDEAALALAQSFHNIQRLRLNDCSLTTIGWETVFGANSKLEEKMEELIIECSELESLLLVNDCKTRFPSKVTILTIIEKKRPVPVSKGYWGYTGY